MSKEINSILINDANLQAYYRFESDVTDDSTNGYDLTSSGAPGYVVGKFGNALDLEAGSSQYAYRNSVANLAITGNISVSLWLKLESLPASEYCMIQIGGSGSLETEVENVLFSLEVTSSGDINWFHEYSTGTNQAGTATNANLQTATWYHLVVMRDTSANEYYFYVDGNLIDTKSYTTDPTGGGNSRLYIGSAYPAAKYFDGILDDIAIFNRVLSADEIKSIYKNAAKTVILV